jgi:ABC-type Mn2+/Zn2+ transport system ATPase subunit
MNDPEQTCPRTHPRFAYSGRRERNAVAGAPAVETVDLVAGYPREANAALHGISLSVPAGRRVALVGPNGAGKSTLLKVLAGVIAPRRGDVRIYGLPVGACHHRVAYLPQRGELDWHFPMTVEHLVRTGRYVHIGWFARPGRNDDQITDRVLRRLGLEGVRQRQLDQISGGQQQRVLLARALAQDADLLLLDEPLNAVDVETRQIIAEVLDGLARQGRTVLVATHDIGRLEGTFDDALYLSEGRETEPPPGAFRGGEESAAP